jgi:transcriptional regulator with XRE-family HTH domain
MKEREVTIASLANAVGVSPKTAAEWRGLNGRIPRDLSVIRKLSQYFNCSTHFLLFGEEDKEQLFEEFLDNDVITYQITIRKIRKAKQDEA